VIAGALSLKTGKMLRTSVSLTTSMRTTLRTYINVIGASLMKLPLEYETNISSFLEKVEANPPISFDDLEAFKHVEPLDFEQ
jgi:hypothetical protein